MKKISKIDKPLIRLTKKKERIQITNIRNEAGDNTKNPADTKKTIRECYKQLYTHTFDNLDKMDHFLEKNKLPQFTQYEIDNLNSSVIIREIEFIIKTFPPKKSPGSISLLIFCLIVLSIVERGMLTSSATTVV